MNTFNLPKMNIYCFTSENQTGKTVGIAFVHTALFKYSGIRIVEGANGRFISFPSQKSTKVDENGKNLYFDRFYPASKEAREALTEAILDAFDNKKENITLDDMYTSNDIKVEVTLNHDEQGNPDVVNGVLATVKVTTPLMVHPWIQVRKSPNSEDEFFLSFPGYKTGKTNENGKDVYNRHFDAFNNEARKKLEEIILAAVEAAM